MEQKTRAWLYCRIDAPEDVHGALKEQKKDLINYAEQMGFEIAGTSADIGNKPDSEQPGLQDVITAAKTGQMSVLLIKNITRLGRDTKITLEYLCKLEMLNISVYSPLEGQINIKQYREQYHDSSLGWNRRLPV